MDRTLGVIIGIFVFWLCFLITVFFAVDDTTTGTYTEGNLRVCTWTKTDQETSIRCDNSKTPHEVSCMVVSQ